MAPKVDATTSSRPWLKEGLRVGLDPVNPDLRGRRPLSARTETLWHTLRPRRTVTVAVTIPRRSAGTTFGRDVLQVGRQLALPGITRSRGGAERWC
jgi:hypothetical protein